MRSEWKSWCARDHVVDARECSGVIYVYKIPSLTLRGQLKQDFLISKGEARREKHEK